MQDLFCGYCYEDVKHVAVNSSCLPTTYDNPWVATGGRCNSTDLKGDLTWAYDFCPTDFSWMPMIGLVLYLMFFAPGWPFIHNISLLSLPLLLKYKFTNVT